MYVHKSINAALSLSSMWSTYSEQWSRYYTGRINAKIVMLLLAKFNKKLELFMLRMDMYITI